MPNYAAITTDSDGKIKVACNDAASNALVNTVNSEFYGPVRLRRMYEPDMIEIGFADREKIPVCAAVDADTVSGALPIATVNGVSVASISDLMAKLSAINKPPNLKVTLL